MSGTGKTPVPASNLDAVMAELAALRRETQAQMADLSAQVAALTALVHRLESEEEISPEMLVMMAAAVTSYLGVKVRIRSARRVDGPAVSANAWAQHGRVFVPAAAHAMRRGSR
jgi:methylmalonyl-CoA carboxyltransferase large subunit